ncbi:uncharacterized protein LOC142242746 isoform X2 [Haematobia irritans]|uniref:uncharacterized protein LOC142242746 isoform X2 n=1 Tax=Haematobia irritans TaxID=7368 RepID=UPI003F50AB46
MLNSSRPPFFLETLGQTAIRKVSVPKSHYSGLLLIRLFFLNFISGWTKLNAPRPPIRLHIKVPRWIGKAAASTSPLPHTHTADQDSGF